MIKIILLVIVTVIVGILVLASTKPDQFSVTRKMSMKASPERIFAEINNFNRWAAWSPWEKKDPAMKRTFSGSLAGVGTVYEWEGNNNVGQGRMEIVGSNTPEKITIKLDFIKPIEGHNIAEFTLTSNGDNTLVNWTMSGPNVFMGKVMSIFIDMDKMIGNDFEQGLINLKSVVEAPSANP